jgi:hypothetical protein
VGCTNGGPPIARSDVRCTNSGPPIARSEAG